MRWDSFKTVLVLILGLLAVTIAVVAPRTGGAQETVQLIASDDAKGGGGG